MSTMLARAALLLASAMPLACGAGAEHAESNHTGSVTLALQSDGVTLNHITYTITGVGFTRISEVDVEHSTTLSALIGGLRPGRYEVKLQATDAENPATECTGSGVFQIVAEQTTFTRVDLRCRTPSTNGSVAISGEVEVCPSIRSISAEPAQIMVGNSTQVFANADDPGTGIYSWTASEDGSLENADTWHPTLTCTGPGNVFLTLVLTSHDAVCGDTATVTIACVGTSPDDPDPNTPGDDRVGYIACVSESCAPGSLCCPTIGVCTKIAAECPSGQVQTCDGPEDCPVAGEQCSVQLNGMNCAVPVYGWGILCHTDAHCLSTPQKPNPCSSFAGQWGQCDLPYPEW